MPTFQHLYFLYIGKHTSVNERATHFKGKYIEFHSFVHEQNDLIWMIITVLNYYRVYVQTIRWS